MSKFAIGQRVRKARGIHGIGTEGRVTAIDESGDPEWSMFVRTDTPMQTICIETGKPAGFESEGWTDPALWEPIAPSGAQPSEYTTLHDLLTSLEGVAA